MFSFLVAESIYSASWDPKLGFCLLLFVLCLQLQELLLSLHFSAWLVHKYVFLLVESIPSLSLWFILIILLNCGHCITKYYDTEPETWTLKTWALGHGERAMGFWWVWDSDQSCDAVSASSSIKCSRFSLLNKHFLNDTWCSSILWNWETTKFLFFISYPVCSILWELYQQRLRSRQSLQIEAMNESLSLVPISNWRSPFFLGCSFLYLYLSVSYERNQCYVREEKEGNKKRVEKIGGRAFIMDGTKNWKECGRRKGKEWKRNRVVSFTCTCSTQSTGIMYCKHGLI